MSLFSEYSLLPDSAIWPVPPYGMRATDATCLELEGSMAADDAERPLQAASPVHMVEAMVGQRRFHTAQPP